MNLADLKKTKAGQRADNAAALSGFPKKAQVKAYEPEKMPHTTAAMLKIPGKKSFIIHVEPMGAVRFTRAQMFSKTLPKTKRASIDRYFVFKKAVQDQVVEQNNGELPHIPDEAICFFYLPMPDSWSEAKKAEMNGTPHRPKPDRDNIEKGVLDALFSNDSAVWKGSQEKRWCYRGNERIALTLVYYATQT